MLLNNFKKELFINLTQTLKVSRVVAKKAFSPSFADLDDIKQLKEDE
jgi:hypothetical protein